MTTVPFAGGYGEDTVLETCGLVLCIKHWYNDNGEIMAGPSYPGFPPPGRFLPD